MKVRKTILQIVFFIFPLLTLVAGCSQDEEKDAYSTISNMIVERNKARMNRAAQKLSSKKNSEDDTSLTEDTSINNSQTDKEKPQTMTFEEEVRIVSTSSGKTISMGTAYLDKSGKIVSIRIKK
ncbi:MAG: hypothetical protein HQK69_01935 [Desulfamplus sp.]|nr:hypothetical protein [Desulfamplus sp.]